MPAEVLEEVRPYLLLAEKLGRFQGQLAKGRVEQIEVEFAGEVAERDVAPITIAALKGLLESVSDPDASDPPPTPRAADRPLTVVRGHRRDRSPFVARIDAAAGGVHSDLQTDPLR